MSRGGLSRGDVWRGGVWTPRAARGWVVFAATFALGLGVAQVFFDEEAGVRRWWYLRSELADARERIAALEAEVARLEGQSTRLEGDPFAVERAIREELGLARPGQIVVRLGGDSQVPGFIDEKSSLGDPVQP